MSLWNPKNLMLAAAIAASAWLSPGAEARTVEVRCGSNGTEQVCPVNGRVVDVNLI